MENNSPQRNFPHAQKFFLRQKISNYAKSLGFDLVGFSPAKIEEKYLAAFQDWLGKGRHGDMAYMEKIAQRRDMSLVLPGAKSVIVLAMNYYHQQADLKHGHGRIARYAYGRDYHKVIGKKLKQLEKFIRELSLLPEITASDEAVDTRLARRDERADPPPQKTAFDSPASLAAAPLTRSYVDTGPIMERALAEQAGLGRIGKNGCLITEKFGSWIFLSEIITTLDLNFTPASPSGNAIPPASSSSRWSANAAKSFNVCGNCTRCVTACPTGAIIAPGVVDSRLCISYLTIENKKKIPPKLAKIIKKTQRLFGCDICQEVCPHNQARAKARPNERSENLSSTASQESPAQSGTTLFQRNSINGLFTPIAGDSLSIKKLLSGKSKTSLNSMPCPGKKIAHSPLSSDASFLQTFAGSPLMRAKRKGLLRNAKILKALNQKHPTSPASQKSPLFPE